jgi:pimeloyl-ACP methyl ester carboxylesterase
MPERLAAWSRASQTCPEGPHLRAAGAPFHLQYFLHRPQRVAADLPPLVAVHGISRNAERQLAVFQRLSESSGRLLIAPLFDKARYQGYQRIKPGRLAADRALICLLETLSRDCGQECGRIALFGFSGGAQFAHRFALFHPERVAQLALASAGWYSFPTENAPFPYGVGRRGARAPAVRLGAFLAIPKLLLVGENDRERDPSLRAKPAVDIRQGADRLERARRWQAALEAAARRLGVKAPLQLATLPQSGHDFEECVEKGGLAERLEAWLARPGEPLADPRHAQNPEEPNWET